MASDSRGRVLPTARYSSHEDLITIPAAAGDVRVAWADQTGRVRPWRPSIAGKLVGVQWQFTIPAGTSCDADLTIDNVTVTRSTSTGRQWRNAQNGVFALEVVMFMLRALFCASLKSLASRSGFVVAVAAARAPTSSIVSAHPETPATGTTVVAGDTTGSGGDAGRRGGHGRTAGGRWARPARPAVAGPAVVGGTAGAAGTTASAARPAAAGTAGSTGPAAADGRGGTTGARRGGSTGGAAARREQPAPRHRGTTGSGGTTGSAARRQRGRGGTTGAAGAGGAAGRGGRRRGHRRAVGAADRIQVVAQCQAANDAQNIRVTFKILNPESAAKQWSDIKVRYYFTPTMPLTPMRHVRLLAEVSRRPC